MPMPTIAAVHGAALGGGCELTLVCDLVVASSEASFAQPEIRLGVIPPLAAALLPRMIPPHLAAEMVLTGRQLSADEARGFGLVNHIASPAMLETAVAALRAREYARLDQQDHVYLDYTAGGLYAESQLREHMELLAAGVYGNPHSASPASQSATEWCDRSRAAILRYFRADPGEYEAI